LLNQCSYEKSSIFFCKGKGITFFPNHRNFSTFFCIYAQYLKVFWRKKTNLFVKHNEWFVFEMKGMKLC